MLHRRHAGVYSNAKNQATVVILSLARIQVVSGRTAAIRRKTKEQKPAESEGNNFAHLPLLRELDDFARNVTSLLCSGTLLAEHHRCFLD